MAKTVFNKEKVDFTKQNMFFGEDQNTQRYDLFKFPVFDKLNQTMLGYFWRPEEVSLQKDRADFANFRPEQKHIFTANLKYQTLKNHYTLLWDMPSNEGYIKVVAVMQKFFDQAISGNWSYNPTHFENNEVPMSVMLQDLLNTYKYGWKTSYYQNTYDYKTDPSELEDDKPEIALAPSELEMEEGADCDACAI